MGRAMAAACAACAALGGARRADGSTALTKGVARNGFVSIGEYKYYKMKVACVEAAQAIGFELTTSNGNADLYVSRSAQPTTSSYDSRSENVGNAADSVTITSPLSGYYYISVYGTLSSTYKLRATTTMFTGKHSCTGFRITDSDFSSTGSGSGNQFVLQEALSASAAASFTADVTVDGDVILGDAYADSVTLKGQLKLGVTDSSSYAITRQAPTSPSTNAGGALSIVGSSATSQGGSVSVLGGAGGTGAGGDVTVEAGSASAGNGGSLYLRGGTSNSGTGGDVVIDAGDSSTLASSYEGVVHIAPNSASFVRVGESTNKQVQTDIFGDVTVHGDLVTTSSLVYATTYSSYVNISTTQDGMFQQEVRVPKLTGLDAEDDSSPTSTLTIDAGLRGSQQHVVIAPTVASYVYIGSSTTTVPISLRQGSAGGDVRFNADASGAVSVTAATEQGITLTTAGAGDITLTSGDTMLMNAANRLSLQQGGADRLVFTAQGRLEITPASGNDISLTTSGSYADIILDAGDTISMAQGGSQRLLFTNAGALFVTPAGAVSIAPATGMDIDLTTTGGYGDIRLTTGGDTVLNPANMLYLQQGGVDRLVISAAGAITLTPTSGQPVTVSGAVVATTLGVGSSTNSGQINKLVYFVVASYDPPAVVAGDTYEQIDTVTGCTLGDFVRVAFTLPHGGMLISAHVSAADTISMYLYNPTASTIDLASGDIRYECTSYA